MTSAYTHAWEDELVFLEPPPEEIEEHGDCVWRSIRVIYGRRKGARSWQEHFDSILKSEEARQRGFTVESPPKCPTLYYVREADGVIELHVDDGRGCGKETIVAELLTFLSEKIEMKYVQGIWCGTCEILEICESTSRKEIDEHPEQETFPISVEKVGDERLQRCEGEGDVVGVVAPLGGVAQVIFHGVQVVEVGVQVRVHQDRGVEEDGEGQVEVEREVEENQGERHMCNVA